MIEESRIRILNPLPENPGGRYVLYWMQQSQRIHYNHALGFAVRKANDLHLPVLVAFVLTDQYPEANARHFAFMLEGLTEIRNELHRRGIAFKISVGEPVEVAVDASDHAALVVCDRGYLRHQRRWRQQMADEAYCTVFEVESDVVVPTLSASHKAEYAARTIRPKINRQLPAFLKYPPPLRLKCKDPDLAEYTDLLKLRQKLKLDETVPPVSAIFKGGYKKARARLTAFIGKVLPEYDRLRNRPESDGSSMLSPYLHFGQISPLEIALAVHRADAPAPAKEAFLEELIVRRELAVNHVCHIPDYDSYEALPQWCRRTLANHINDPRDPVYTEKELDAATTHDPYWNAAMNEMKHTGYMHNYMRMYWGKKILQWTPDPQQAFMTALRLNNRYLLDGRDPNSYAGVSWIFGLHDRPWKERPIFGQIRYMARSGLERKFDMKGYVEKVNRLSCISGRCRIVDFSQSG